MDSKLSSLNRRGFLKVLGATSLALPCLTASAPALSAPLRAVAGQGFAVRCEGAAWVEIAEDAQPTWRVPVQEGLAWVLLAPRMNGPEWQEAALTPISPDGAAGERHTIKVRRLTLRFGG